MAGAKTVAPAGPWDLGVTWGCAGDSKGVRETWRHRHSIPVLTSIHDADPKIYLHQNDHVSTNIHDLSFAQ